MACEATNRNLIPMNKRPLEEQRKLQLAGGYASGRVRKAKRSFREALKTLLGTKVPKDSKLYERAMEQMRMVGLKGTPDVLECINLGVLAKALKGDIMAATFIRDTSGEKPVDQTEDLTPPPPVVLGLFDPDRVAAEKAQKCPSTAIDPSTGPTAGSEGENAAQGE